MPVGAKWILTLALLGSGFVTGCQPNPKPNQAITPAAQTAPAVVERPRILDDSGQVVSELFFPPGKTQVVLQLTQFRSGWLIRGLQLNGHDVGWMLLDTGINLTTVDTTVAEELQLKPLTPDHGKNYAYFRTAACLDLADLTLRNHYVAAIDFSPVRRAAGISIKGSMGGDLLGQVPYSLDFTAGTITFYDRKHFQPPVGAHELPLQLSGKPTTHGLFSQTNLAQGIPMVQGQIGGVNCQVGLDTGTSTSLIINPVLCRAHPELVDLEKGVQASAVVLGGASNMYLANTRNVVLFDQVMNLQAVYAQPEDSSLVGAFGDFEAVAGMGVLENYRLTFDYAAGRMWIEPRPLPTVQARLAAGMDPNAPLLDNCTPLMVAAGRGDLAGVEALLKAGARVEGHDTAGRTALMFAVMYGGPELVQVLLNADNKRSINERSANGTTALMLAPGRKSEIAIIQLLLQAGADVTVKNTNDASIAHFAAARSGAKVIELLLANNVDFNLCNQKNFRPLDIAAYEGRMETFLALLRAGARSSNPNGESLLLQAASNPNPEILNYLLKTPPESTKLNTPSKSGTTPLMVAANKGRISVVKALLAAGADLKLVDEHRKNALGFAVRYPEIITLLLQAGANPNPATWGDIPPLTAAAAEGNLQSVELLLTAGAMINAHAQTKYAPLWAAVAADYPQLVELFIKRKANIELRLPTGETALLLAAQNSASSLDLLIHAGAKLHDVPAGYLTALHVAAQAGNLDSVKLLLKAGVNIEAYSSEYGTPLCVAITQDHPAVVRALLTAGADPQITLPDGNTPLRYAHGKPDMLKLLEAAIAQRQAATRPVKP